MNSACRTIVFMSIIIAAFSENLCAEEWVKLGETRMGLVFYDKASVERTNKNIAKATMKQILSNESARAFAKEYPETAGVAYFIMFDTVICREERYEISKSVFYDIRGKIIHDTSKNRAKRQQIGFRPIPSGTPIAWLAEVICHDG